MNVTDTASTCVQSMCVLAHVTNWRTEVEKHSPTKAIKNIMNNANIQGVQGALGTQKGLTSQESGVAVNGRLGGEVTAKPSQSRNPLCRV